MKKIIIVFILLICTSCFNKNINGYNLYKDEISSYFNSEWHETKLDNNQYKYEKNNNIITIKQEKNNYSKNNHIRFQKEIYQKLIKIATKNNYVIFGNSFQQNNNIIYKFTLKNESSFLTYYYIVGNYQDLLIITSTKSNEEPNINEIINKIINNFKWK